MAARLWRKPRLRADDEENNERRSTWLELFYDLLFVVIVAELAQELADDATLPKFGEFLLLFVSAWWVWTGSTVYNDRFETEDLSQRLFTFLLLLPAVGLALSAPDALGETSRLYALSYAASRAVLIWMWLRGGYHEAVARPMTTRFAIGFTFSLLCWAVSVFVPAPARFVLWGVGLVADLITPFTTFGFQGHLPKLTTSHLPERFGLFTIIVLGESIAGFVGGAAAGGNDLTPEIVTISLLCLSLAFTLWWVYFDQLMDRAVKPGVWWRAAWSYAHLPLVVGLTALGAGAIRIAASEGERLEAPAAWLCCGGMAAALAAVGAIELTLTPDEADRKDGRRLTRTRFAAAAVALSTGLFADRLNPAWLFVLLAAVGVSQIAYGAYLRVGAAPADESKGRRSLDTSSHAAHPEPPMSGEA